MNASFFATGFATEDTAPRIPLEVKALIIALQLGEPDTSLLKRLSDDEWTKLFAFAKIANLTLPLALLPMEGFPHWVVERLITNLADNALRFNRVKATYREAAEALERAGVEHIVIKGFTQSPDYVADPRLRLQNDIDFFCPPDSIKAAHGALTAIGYEPSSIGFFASSDHDATLVRQGGWEWRGNSFDPEMPLSMELHFCLWNQRVSHIGIPDVDLFWKRRTMREVGGLTFPCLNSADHFGYIALHILRNLFLRDWIVHLVRELAAFLHLRADDDIFWRLWLETHSPSLRTFEAIAIYYARAWFRCRLHPLVALEIDRLSLARRSWLQSFSYSAIEHMFERNKDSLWLQLTFIASRREQWKVVKRALIPTPAAIVSINSPVVRLRNKWLVPSNGRGIRQQYIAYLISLSVDHLRADCVTLWRGLSWRLSRHLPTL
ncbi:MAG: nucleotidyltransferase family protein [Terracidiphilus sp.]